MSNLKEVNIKNGAAIISMTIKFEDFNLGNILIDGKSYENSL